MPQAATLELPRADVVFREEKTPGINDLTDATNIALAAFALTTDSTEAELDGRIRMDAGPVRVEFIREEDGPRVNLCVIRLRDTERLHPEAETAILAEIISILVERFGGGTLDWGGAGVRLDLERFAASFVPLRRRGGATRIRPRRVHLGDTIGTPMQMPQPAPKPVVANTPSAPHDPLKDVFADDEIEDAPSGLTHVSAWAATASVGAMNPLIGVPLIAYNLAKGADIRVSTNAFALTATLTGLAGSSYGYLPFF